MFSSNGVANGFETSARIAQAYSPTLTRAHVCRNHTDGGGVGSEVDFKHL
jgi:hypothetical protein